jgi:hypothetical protein
MVRFEIYKETRNMAKLTVIYGGAGFDVTIDDDVPYSFYIDKCARQLGLPRKWREMCYSPGVNFVDTVIEDTTIRLFDYFLVKVHFNGGKTRVRATQGSTTLAIVEAAAEELHLPGDWRDHVTCQNAEWTAVFTADGEIFLQDPRIQRR